MPLRWFVPLPGPVVWTPKSKVEKVASAPVMTPERNAESKHESRHGVRWVVFGCLALSGLLVQGDGALWWLIPIAVVLVLVQAVSNHEESTASPATLAERSARRQITARAKWDPASGCGWCGSAARHKDADRRPQTPAQFHAGDIDAAVAAQVQAQFPSAGQ